MTYACHNKPRDFQEYPAQDGWFYEYSGMTRKPKIVQVPHVMSRDCRYDRQEQDPKCKGCHHLPVDATLDPDFQEVNKDAQAATPYKPIPMLTDVLHAATAETASAIAPKSDFERCRHPGCGRYPIENGRFLCSAMSDNACARHDYKEESQT